MTASEVREAIASAATTVDGVNVAPYFRQITRPGDGTVQLNRLDRDESGLGYVARWNVVIVLPNEVSQAERWIEERLDALMSALHTELVVTAVVPSQLQLDSGAVPAVVIEGSRAHE